MIPSSREPSALRVPDEAQASLVSMLTFAADTFGRPLDKSRVEEALSGTDPARAKLARAAAGLGLRASSITLSVDESTRNADPESPLFALCGERDWLAVCGRDGDHVRVMDASGTASRIAADGVAKRLGLSESREEAVFLSFDPLYEMPGAVDDHGHAHDHDHGHATPFDRVRALVSAEKSDVLVIAVYGALVGLTTLAVPVAVQALVSSVGLGTVLQPIVVLTVLLTLVLAFAGFLRVAQAKLVELLQERLFVRSALDLAARLPSRDDLAEGGHGPEQVNRFLDVVTVQKSAAGLLLDGLALVLQLVLGLALLAFYHPLLLAFDVILIAAVVFVVLVLGRRGPSTSITESKAKYTVLAWLEEVARHPSTFRAESARTFALETTDRKLGDYLAARRQHFRILLRQIVGSLILHTLASSLLLGLGAWLVLQGQLSLGQLVAAELVVTAVVSGVAKLGKHLESYYDLVAALDKLGHLAEMKTEPSRGAPIADVGALSLTLRFDGKAHAFLPASRTRLSGEGASELLAALYGEGNPELRVEGAPIAEVELGSYRDLVARVKEPEVFEGTVLENVRVGRADITVADARNALETVGLGARIAGLPDGIHSAIEPAGANLSHADALRLTLARALARKPRLLLLDGTLERLTHPLPDPLKRALFGTDRETTLVVRSESDAHAFDATIRLDEENDQ
jgi:putative ABC transport system ATP-binding protein